MHRCRPAFLLCALTLSSCNLGIKAQTLVPDQCSKTADMYIYSNVFVHQESGDLLGYELAIKRQADSRVEALLYVYEGGGAGDGIPLAGEVSKNHLILKGTWDEQLIEYPSKKIIVEHHAVELIGTVDLSTFRGELTISDIENHQHIRLSHVKRIWFCYDK